MTSPAPLFHSDLGLFDFQADGAANAYLRKDMLAVWDTGLGKTVLGIATACLLFEDGLVDVAVVVAESGKIRDWSAEDFPRFSDLTVAEYSGTPTRRAKVLAKGAQVLVTTYETGRNDICAFKPHSKAVAASGPLTEYLRDKRVLFVFDEVSKLRNRSSKLYVAWDYLLNRVLRKRAMDGDHVRALGMTGTTTESSGEDHADIARLLGPQWAPPVGEFNRDHVATWNPFRPNTPGKLKNLSEADHEDPHVVPLTVKLRPLIHRKRKTDSDVIDQFPRKVERRPTMVKLSPLHYDFLDAVYDRFSEELGDNEHGVLWNIRRQLASHPAAALYGHSDFARQIVEIVGEAGLRNIGSEKVGRMLDWCSGDLGSSQGVIFTFYGQSILPILHAELNREGYTVSINHGGMTPGERQESQRRFKAGDTQLFLSSDAGARGLNLGCGSALLHYEPPTLWSIHEQRSNRIHRIDSRHPSVVIDTLCGIDTIDEAALDKQVLRQGEHDQLVNDDILLEDTDPGAHFVSAEDRKRMVARARMAAKRAA